VLVSRLKATGWVPPAQITVKARDGKTDLYGLIFKPSEFDETKTYPIVNRIYPGRRQGSLGHDRSRPRMEIARRFASWVLLWC